jgi:hypothetical protein
LRIFSRKKKASEKSQCSYIAITPEFKTGKERAVYFPFEQYLTIFSAQEKYADILDSNQNMPG